MTAPKDALHALVRAELEAALEPRELLRRGPEALAELVDAATELALRRMPGEARVRVWNPAGPRAGRTAVEILGHRVFWSMVAMVLLVAVTRRSAHLLALVRDRRTALLLVTAAVVITANWGVYIWGVNSEHVVETSLGYYINPLVTVLIGVVLLGERLRGVQWVAIGVAAITNVALASLGGLQILVLVILTSPAGIFSNFVREMGRPS